MFSLFGDGAYRRSAFTHNDLAELLLHQFEGHLENHVPIDELGLFYEKVLSNEVFLGDHNASFMSERTLLSGAVVEEVPTSFLYGFFHDMVKSIGLSLILERYRSQFPRGLPGQIGKKSIFLLEEAIGHLQGEVVSSEAPFLGYYHFFPPHKPYNTRREFIDRFKDGWTPVAKPAHFFTEGNSDEDLNARRREYDEYVAYADAEFGRFLDFMEGGGHLANTYLVLTSDHGEMFERGIAAHVTPTLYEPIIHIPLLISHPGQTQRVDIHTITSSVDVVPTLLAGTGRPIPDWIEGQTLPNNSHGDAGQERVAYCVEAKSNAWLKPLTTGTVALLRGEHKLVHYFGYRGFEHQFEFYDLAEDPEELEDLYPKSPSVCRAMEEELLEKLHKANETFSP
jgi:hypothetical protein